MRHGGYYPERHGQTEDMTSVSYLPGGYTAVEGYVLGTKLKNEKTQVAVSILKKMLSVLMMG